VTRNVSLPFLGECYSDEAKPFSSQDVVNWLPAPAEKPGTLTPEMAQTPPGLAPFVEVSGINTSKPVRGTYNCEGKLFTVIGNQLYQITNAGVAIPIGTIPGVTRTRFAHNQVTNGNQLVTVNGSAGYVYGTPTEVFQRITDPGYPGAITADFVDGYIVGIEPGRRFAFNSDLANALEYNTLDRFTSEYKPDLLVTQVVSNNELILLSETSGEVFYNSGAAQQPFRTKRVFFDKGCSGRNNAAVVDNSFVFHANDGMFYLYQNGVPKRISTRPIEQAVAGLNWSQGFAEVWIDGGHSVVYWTFPGGHTWGWDASSGKWHRRESYGLTRWRANTLTKWTKSGPGKRDEWVAGDFQRGRLWRVDWDYMLEGDQEFVSEIVGVALSDNQNPLTMPRLEVMLDTGQELTVAPNPLFPIQPDPPMIAGDAPTATLTVAYNFAYTVTPGDAPIASVVLRSGELPPGLSMDNAGVITGTPTTIGSYPYTVRATDTNGLYDDHDDTIAVSLDGAIPIPTLKTLLFGVNGGGAWDIASEQTDLSFSEVTISTEPWARFFCWAYDQDGTSKPPETRTIIYDAPSLGGEVFYDSGWHGNPANQAAMTAALGVSGLSAYDGTIQDDMPVVEYGTYGSFLYASTPFVLATDFGGNSSGRRVIYRSGSRLDSATYLEYPDPAEIPVGAVKLDGYPGYYTAGGQLYVCDWEAT
jgi:hypothetical protein